MNLPVNYGLIFAELILEKNIEIPDILKKYLANKQNDPVNFMRLLLKYRRYEDCLNLIVELICSKKYIPNLELNIVHILYN